MAGIGDIRDAAPVQLKNGSIVAFKTVKSAQQQELLDAMDAHPRVAVVKARQIGISTVCRIHQVVYALTHPNVRCAILSNKQRSARELGQIDDLILKLSPRRVKRRTADEIELTNGSRILRFSGASRNDRGYTIDHLHVTEYAFIDRGPDVLASVLAAMSPRGKVIIESTPSHYGDSLHQLIQEESSWKSIFFPWYSFPEYQADASGYKLTPNDTGLTPEQAAWRYAKVQEYAGDLRRFRREYPSSITEAYSLAGGTYLDDTIHVPVSTYVSEVRGEKTIQKLTSHKKNPQYQYVIGYDPAGGTGGDYACATVYCRNTGEVVQTIASNRTSIGDFTRYLIQVSDTWNRAHIHVESNNHGHAAETTLQYEKFPRYSTATTTMSSKIQGFDTLRRCLYNGTITSIDPTTAKELRTLEVSNKGLAPSAAIGCHDDHVMALCLAITYAETRKLNTSPISGDRYDYLYGTTKAPHRSAAR